MPERRKPRSGSELVLQADPRSAWLSIISGSSRGSRPILRTQPQLRLDCSAASAPFSQSTTETPRSARNIAVLTPMMPPPMTTTSAARGRLSSVAQSSIGGPECRSDAAILTRNSPPPDGLRARPQRQSGAALYSTEYAVGPPRVGGLNRFTRRGTWPTGLCPISTRIRTRPTVRRFLISARNELADACRETIRLNHGCASV